MTVCLSMIVKDEAAVITRCLASVAPFIDHWVISDTGSTDGTQDIIREFFAGRGIPGELHEDPWIDFATNRNLALEAAKGKADYILIMDADDYLLPGDASWLMPPLSAPAYLVPMQLGGISYSNIKLVRADMPWYWVGVLHEYLACDVPHYRESLTGCTIIAGTEGSRSRNPQKYQDDARVLEDACNREPHNTRYRFYLAQSYRDAGMHRQALDNYRQRAVMGGWDEEVFYSLFQVAVMLEILNHSPDEITDAYLMAFEYRPVRAEPLHYLSAWLSSKQRHALAAVYGRYAKTLPVPADILFVEPRCYASE